MKIAAVRNSRRSKQDINYPIVWIQVLLAILERKPTDTPRREIGSSTQEQLDGRCV